MEILVTGATGFLGRTLCRTLHALGHKVVAVGSKECDLTKDNSLDQFNNHTFDQIYHLAIWTQAGDFSLHHQGEVWIINQKINTNMISWWKDHQPQAKMITMGTSCSYESGALLKEENYLLGLPHSSLFSYAMSKRMLYVGLLSMQRQFGMKYLSLVPSTLYGSGYHNDGRQLHFIFDLIRKILNAKEGKEPAILWGSGFQKRELVLVDDFVKIMLQLVETEENKLINIGAGEEHSIRDFAKLICKKVDYDFNLVQYDTTKYVGATSKCLNIEQLKKLIPNLSYTPLIEGINKTVAWYREKDLIQKR